MDPQSWITLAVGGGIAILSAALTSYLSFVFGERAAKRERQELLEDVQHRREDSLSDERRQYRRVLEEKDAEIILHFIDKLIDDMQQDMHDLTVYYSDPAQNLEALRAQMDRTETLSQLASHAQGIAFSMSSDVISTFEEFLGAHYRFMDISSGHEDRINELEDDWEALAGLRGDIQELLRGNESPVLKSAGELRRKIRDYLSAGNWS